MQSKENMDTNSIKLFFWQNVISIHQKALLSALGKQCKTALIVEKEFSGKRLQQGWTKETIPGMEIIVSPSSQSVKNIIDNNNATNCIHIISGFSNFCFKKEDLINRMYEKGIKPFIIAEAYQNNDGIKTFVRYFYTDIMPFYTEIK